MSDDFSKRAAKGQAYNLAIQEAIAEGNQGDNKRIIELFLKHLDMASLLQKASVADLATAIDNPKFIKLIRELDDELSKD